MFNLSGKVALVTGGAGHLGSAISEGLMQAGTEVIIASRDEDRCEQIAADLRMKHTKSFAVGTKLDVTSKKSIEDCFKRVYKAYGKIDVLVNNAMNWGYKDFNKSIGMIIGSVFDCSMAALPYMNNGSIINIASMYGVIADHPKIYAKRGQISPPAYFAGKGGIITLTKWLACHFSQNRANCVSFGAFPSQKVQRDVNFIQRLQEQIPLGRIGQPSEAAGAVVFLASDEASYITGHNLIVDGGWTAW